MSGDFVAGDMDLPTLAIRENDRDDCLRAEVARDGSRWRDPQELTGRRGYPSEFVGRHPRGDLFGRLRGKFGDNVVSAGDTALDSSRKRRGFNKIDPLDRLELSRREEPESIRTRST